MATGGDVMTMLCDGVEYVIYGDDYDSINWFDKQPAITKAEFEAGFAKYDDWKAGQDSKVQADKAALLSKLGITAEEAVLLLS